MTPPDPAQQEAKYLVRQIEGLRHRLHQCDEGGCGYTVQAIKVIATALRQAEARGRQTMKPWMKHLPHCDLSIDWEVRYQCTCGLDATLPPSERTEAGE